MNHFAIIAEGITDQVTIEAILTGFYGQDLDFVCIQPARDSTDISRQADHGGWEKVLIRCQQEDFVDIFSFNKYVIIQIDTDQGEHPNYGVSLTQGGVDRTPADIINDVKTLIISKLGIATYTQFSHRIVFAIAVHSTDCWYLPLYANTYAHKIKTKGCANTLARALISNGKPLVKDYRCYTILARPFENKQQLDLAANQNASLEEFINNLPNPI